MNLPVLLSAAAGLWWIGSAAVLVSSIVAAGLHPLRRRRTRCANQPPVSTVVPVKQLHHGFEEAQRSLLAQAYPQFEVLFAAGERKSDALAAAERIRSAFPNVPSRIISSNMHGAVSPKLDVLWPALREADNDLILTKDSNLTLAPGELQDLVGELAMGVGLVSSIPIAREPRSFAAWVEAAILNNHHARVLMLADAGGAGFGLGKIMLFRRSELMRAGGYNVLSWALGEDMAISRALRSTGLRTVLARRVSTQTLGARRIGEVYQRQLRWTIVWRTQAPAAFIGALLCAAAPTALASAAAAPLVGFAPWLAAGGTLAGWFALECILCAAKGWPLGPLSLPAFLTREILAPFIWLRALTTRKVIWGGAVRSARNRPRSEQIAHDECPRGAPQ